MKPKYTVFWWEEWGFSHVSVRDSTGKTIWEVNNARVDILLKEGCFKWEEDNSLLEYLRRIGTIGEPRKPEKESLSTMQINQISELRRSLFTADRDPTRGWTLSVHIQRQLIKMRDAGIISTNMAFEFLNHLAKGAAEGKEIFKQKR